MQKQIAISIMQFDMLNNIYGGNKGAGRLIERVYQELQPVLNKDPHYWLQRSKSIYMMNSNNADKLREAYQFCVKAADDKSRMNDKLYAQTSLSLSLISGLLSELVAEDDAMSFAETCINKGYIAMKSEYYSPQHRRRLEKEKAGWRRSYEDLYRQVCENYINNVDIDGNVQTFDFKTEAIDVLRMISGVEV